MAKISKFLKLDKDVLLEYVYDDGNLISEKYKLLTDTRNRRVSYMAGDSSSTGNTQVNQLFNIDLTEIRYGRIDPTFYTYLNVADFSSTMPVRHDTMKFHLPINWTFGEHLGFYVKVFTFDTNHVVMFNVSNFFFDMTDTNQQDLMEFSAPPLLFQEKLWGKAVVVEIPAISQIAAQLTNGNVKPNSINYNLTGGLGLSLTSPIMIEFFFVDGIQKINGVTTYTLGQKISTSLPQTPEFESLGLKILDSPNGDFFEIFGTYNNNINEFNRFIQDSVRIGHKYYVQYDITVYEQNVRGKTITVTMMDNFNESVEYRPIIKNSTTTAIIDVEMRLIDSVDDSQLIRRASYGMLQDEVSKYSSSMSKINLINALKPKIYNIKNNIDPSLLGKTNALGIPLGTRGRTGKGLSVGIAYKKGPGTGASTGIGAGSNAGAGSVQTVKVPYAVLVDKNNVIAKSENQFVNKELFYGIGKMEIFVYPFDNILKFVLASGSSTNPGYLDLTSYGEIRLVFKSDSSNVEFGIWQEANEVDLAMGMLAFKIPSVKINQIKAIFNSGINLFYITATAGSNTTVVYTGLFRIYDSAANVSNLKTASANPTIVQDPALPVNTAVVTYKPVTSATDPQKKP